MGSYLLSHLLMWCFDQLVNILYPAECEGNPVISANICERYILLSANPVISAEKQISSNAHNFEI